MPDTDSGSSGHDSDDGKGGRAKDADRIAYEARDAIRHDKTFRVNEADPMNAADGQIPQGNPDSSTYNKSRKLGS